MPDQPQPAAEQETRDLLAKTQKLYAAAEPGSVDQKIYAYDIRILRALIDYAEEPK